MKEVEEFGLRFLFLKSVFRLEVGSQEEKLCEYEDKKAGCMGDTQATAFSGTSVLFCSPSAFPGHCVSGACYSL